MASRELQIIHDDLHCNDVRDSGRLTEPEMPGPGIDEIGLALTPPPGDDAQRGHAERCGSGIMGGLLCQR